MTTLYVIENTNDMGEEPVIDHQAELAARRFACHLFIRTLRDARDYYKWTREIKYHNRFYHQFGFSKDTPRRAAMRFVRDCMWEWLNCETFKWLCKKLDFDEETTRHKCWKAMEGRFSAEIERLLSHFKEELTFYARRGPKPKKAQQQQGIGRHRPGA